MVVKDKPTPAVPDRDQCKAELEAVIASGIFAKAPSLALLLAYICTKYFEGQANQVKEYNIAVEALGRPPSFDPRQDSIVRVEAFRLRKRLKQYYDGEGAERDLRIVVPSGQYVPQFLHNDRHNGANGSLAVRKIEAPGAHDFENLANLALETAPLAVQEEALAIAPVAPIVTTTPTAPPQRSSAARIAALAVLPVILAAGIGAIWYFRAHASAVSATKTTPLPLGAESEEVRVLAGLPGGRYVDHAGNIWSGDRFFHGGTVFATPNHPIYRTVDPDLFRNRREGDFTYDIPLKPGVYELHLFFAETLFGEDNTGGGAESSRVFRVLINGQDGIMVFDVIADAGGSSTADEKVFKDVSPAADGMLHLHFAALFKETPFLNAIEIVPGTPGRLHPVRIAAGSSHAFTDRSGVTWGADRYFSHGSTVTRSERVADTPDPEIYAVERFGNFSYAIPVAPGHYLVNLKFAETWFGPGKPGGGGAGSRVFDVYCNGTALLRNFDIFRAADGAQRAVERSFHGISANAQGKIVLTFVPVVNYASINAIEVLDESK